MSYHTLEQQIRRNETRHRREGAAAYAAAAVLFLMGTVALAAAMRQVWEAIR